MAYYKYSAINSEGRIVKGRLSADSPAELSAILLTNGLELFVCKEKKRGGALFKGIDPKDLITMFVHLEQLERAGVSIMDSINDLKNTSDSTGIRGLMQEVHDSIKNGNLFSESLAKRPDVFSQVYIGLLQAGEKTGNLADSFSSIVEDLKWNMDMKRKTKKATIGPLFGVFMILAVLGAMTTVVIPKVTGFLVSQDVALPGSTRSLIGFSNFAKQYWMFIVFSIPLVMLATKLLGRNKRIGILIDEIKLKTPIIGPILSKLDSAKFCQFFSVTFKSGLGVLDCLDAAGKVVKNKAIKHSVDSAKRKVSDGQALAAAIAGTGHFPTLVSRMFRVGEESGNMESALNNIKFFYDREINDSIDRLVGMIQPSITLLTGGLMVWIVLAVFGPVYGMFSKM